MRIASGSSFCFCLAKLTAFVATSREHHRPVAALQPPELHPLSLGGDARRSWSRELSPPGTKPLDSWTSVSIDSIAVYNYIIIMYYIILSCHVTQCLKITCNQDLDCRIQSVETNTWLSTPARLAGASEVSCSPRGKPKGTRKPRPRRAGSPSRPLRRRPTWKQRRSKPFTCHMAPAVPFEGSTAAGGACRGTP